MRDRRRETIALDERSDRVALVTGAAGGIGQAILRELVERGWRVLATDVISEADFPEGDDAVRYFRADVTDAEAMRLAARAASELGTLSGCIANAGVVTEEFVPFLEAPPESWKPTLLINLLGTLNTFQAVANVMARAGGGRMAATSSVAGVRPEADIVAYSASKAGVISIVKSLALELGKANISVNALAPGPVGGGLQHTVVEGRDLAERRAGGYAYGTRYEHFRHDNRPFGRLATREEIAGTFGWLLSDAAAYVTGQVVVIDGGGVLV